ncbi:MAG: hypothetical protein WAV10_01310 [Minisyncoccia bacterium]
MEKLNLEGIGTKEDANKKPPMDTKEIADGINDVESLTTSEKEELARLKKLQEKLKVKDIGSRLAGAFLTKDEKRIREIGEKFADKFLFNNKKERDFIAKQGAAIKNAIDKGYFAEPTQAEMRNILDQATMDNFIGKVGPDAKTNKASYTNSKNLKFGSALSGAPSL